MISVVLADDQGLIRSAVAELVSHEPGMTVLGQVENGAQAVAVTRELKPDVVLMDIRMPVMDGIQATQAIRSDPQLDGSRVLILTTFEDDDYVLDALRAGASGFIGKGTDPESLMTAIRVVHAGDALLSPKATRALIARYLAPRPPAPTTTLSTLTKRERQVLVAVGLGKSNSEIAQELFISVHTAKTHVSRIMGKLLARDRTHLVIAAYEAGLVGGET